MTDSVKPQNQSLQLEDPDELEDVAGRAIAATAERSELPVHLWNPRDCGQIPMEIRKDGSWWHQGSPIKKVRTVALFGLILK